MYTRSEPNTNSNLFGYSGQLVFHSTLVGSISGIAFFFFLVLKNSLAIVYSLGFDLFVELVIDLLRSCSVVGIPQERPMEFVAEEGKQLDAECSTLVLPALSIGNVGQLAVDLLISTLKAEKIGYLDDPNVLPCVGNNAYWPSPAGDLALPLEVYESSSHGLTFIQLRSPVVKGMLIQFAKNLSDFAAANGKKHVVVISGLDFIHWAKLDLSSGLQVHYLSDSSMDGTDEYCEILGWKKLQEYNPDLRGWKYLNLVVQNDATQEDFPAEELEEEDYYPSLPFAALFSCFKAKGLKVTCLLCYCSEGDNTPEAFHLAEATTKLLKLSPDNIQGNGSGGWIIPFSWKSVYGPPPDYSMF